MAVLESQARRLAGCRLACETCRFLALPFLPLVAHAVGGHGRGSGSAQHHHGAAALTQGFGGGLQDSAPVPSPCSPSVSGCLPMLDAVQEMLAFGLSGSSCLMYGAYVSP